MALEVGMHIKVTCIDGEVFMGKLTDICVGMCKEEPTQASIILLEDKKECMTYGQVHLWCSGLKWIEEITVNHL